MKIGDLIDDGLDNVGIILKKLDGFDDEAIYWCHFPNGDGVDGWYDCYDIKKILPPMETVCK